MYIKDKIGSKMSTIIFISFLVFSICTGISYLVYNKDSDITNESSKIWLAISHFLTTPPLYALIYNFCAINGGKNLSEAMNVIANNNNRHNNNEPNNNGSNNNRENVNNPQNAGYKKRSYKKRKPKKRSYKKRK